jgi:hypothetical protein
MKRTTILISVFSLVLFLATGWNPAFGAPKAVSDEMDFNAGDVQQGCVISHEFIIKSAGSDPLTLKVKSCTCGGVKYEAPSSIAPGKTDKIRVSIPTKYLKGSYQKDVLIETNDPEKKEIHFTIRATVQEILSITPHSIIFGRVKTGSSETREISITNNGKEPVTISQIEINPGVDITISPQGKTILQPGQTLKVTATFKPGKDLREINTLILIKTDIKKLPEIAVTAFAVVVQ